MFHEISRNHLIFNSKSFLADSLAFNLMSTILADTEHYPDTICLSDEKSCILVNTDNQHPIIIWTSDDFQHFETLYQFIQTQFQNNNPLSFICKEAVFDFYQTKQCHSFENIEVMGVYICNNPSDIAYVGYPDNIQQNEVETVAEMAYQFYLESMGDNYKSFQDCMQDAQKFVTDSNYKVWRNPEGKIVSLARIRLSDNINRIGMVYTLPEERGKSYAKMLVHYLTKQIKEKNKTPVLYTDFSYEPSNKCYTKIGYRLINKIVNFSIQK